MDYPRTDDRTQNAASRKPQIALNFQMIVRGWSTLPKVSSRLISRQYLRGVATQHSALVDTFDRYHNYLRISLTERCNLRCVYCMPLEGVQLTAKSQIINLDENKRLINIFAHLGITKIRFTGGEPTVSKQLPKLIEHCRSHKQITSIGITSNGLVLKEKLDDLIAAGLTSANISLDTLSEAKFAQITRRDGKGLNKVLAAIYSAAAKGLPVKINTVMMRGTNLDEIGSFVDLTRDVELDCRFIELMPFDGNDWTPSKFVGYFEALDLINQSSERKLSKIQGESVDPHDTTKWYRAGGAYGQYIGRVGFITSMSSHFCGGCNRLRITADGKLKVCLFGEENLNLLQCIRDGLSDDEIISRIAAAVRRKKAVLGGHKDMGDIAASDNRPMILIGG